MGLMLFII